MIEKENSFLKKKRSLFAIIIFREDTASKIFCTVFGLILYYFA